MKVYHEILLRSESLPAGVARLGRFFEKYELVRYDQVNIREDQAMSAEDPGFSVRLEAAVVKNRLILGKLIDDIQAEGLTSIADFKTLAQGYTTKMLHTAIHFLDGFFGVDSFFYNLDEDSHWLTEEYRRKIDSEPENYWLLPVEAEFGGVSADRTGLVRSAGL